MGAITRTFQMFIFGICGLVMLPIPVWSQNPDSPTVSSNAQLPVYRPPNMGMPGRRETGGSRRVILNTPSVEVLVPRQGGWTAEARPKLYWYLSIPWEGTAVVTLENPKTREILVNTRMSEPSPGMYEIDLAKYRVELREGYTYHWKVSLMPKKGTSQENKNASGTLQRIKTPSNLPSLLKQYADQPYFAYAEAGLWFEAVDTLQDQIKTQPDNSLLKKHFGSLLTQVGLQGVVANTP